MSVPVFIMFGDMLQKSIYADEINDLLNIMNFLLENS